MYIKERSDRLTLNVSNRQKAYDGLANTGSDHIVTNMENTA